MRRGLMRFLVMTLVTGWMVSAPGMATSTPSPDSDSGPSGLFPDSGSDDWSASSYRQEALGLRHAFVRSRDPNTRACLFWPQRNIRWFLNDKTDVADAPFADVEDAIQDSFAQWESVTCSDLSFTFEGLTDSTFVGYRRGEDNRNLLIFRTETCVDVVPEADPCWESPGRCANVHDCWEHSSGVIALTTTNYNTASGVILDSDVEFNSAGIHFTTRDGPPCAQPGDRDCAAFDVANTATHEIGHMIGFDHSGDPNATMFARAELGEVSKRELSRDDIEGLCSVYPAGEPPRTCTPSGRVLVIPADDTDGCGDSGSLAGALVLLAFAMPFRFRGNVGRMGRG